jgi:hypothetical protein
VIASYKHSTLFGLIDSDKGKKFYNIDTRAVHHCEVRRIRPQRPEPPQHVCGPDRDAQPRRHLPRGASQRDERGDLGPARSGLSLLSKNDSDKRSSLF